MNIEKYVKFAGSAYTAITLNSQFLNFQTKN